MSACRPIIIALCSPAMGSGKSVIAEHLVERHQFQLVKFAHGLKAMTAALLGSIGYGADEIHDAIEGDAKETVIPALGVTPRRIMQTLGTECGRDCIDPDIWANIAAARCASILATGRSIIIDDLRYENELGVLHLLGAYVYRIVRPGVTVTATHSSEGSLDGLRMAEIHNDGTIDDLTAKVDALLHSL